MIKNPSEISNIPPLEYSKQTLGLQELLASWMGSVVMIYAAVSIGADISQVAFLWPRIFGFWSIDSVGLILVLADSFSGVASLILFCAGIISIKERRISRLALARSCWVIATMKVIQMIVALCFYMMKNEIYRFGTDFSHYIATPSSLSLLLFSTAQQVFIPVLAILISGKSGSGN